MGDPLHCEALADVEQPFAKRRFIAKSLLAIRWFVNTQIDAYQRGVPTSTESRREETIDHGIKAGKERGAKTARDAAEIAFGRPLTGVEWSAVGPLWRARWD